MVECWGGISFWRDMKTNWGKIPLVANELGVSTKTIYNWINSGKLYMPQPGYVDKDEAFAVWVDQRTVKSITSYFMAIKGIKRDTRGRFTS